MVAEARAPRFSDRLRIYSQSESAPQTFSSAKSSRRTLPAVLIFPTQGKCGSSFMHASSPSCRALVQASRHSVFASACRILHNTTRKVGHFSAGLIMITFILIPLQQARGKCQALKTKTHPTHEIWSTWILSCTKGEYHVHRLDLCVTYDAQDVMLQSVSGTY